MEDTFIHSDTNHQPHIIGTGVVILRTINNEIEVLLIRRGKPPRLGDWSIPGGRQELGETVRESAAREVKEETSLIVNNLGLVDVVDTFTKDSIGNINVHWTLVDFRAWWEGDTAQAGSDATEVKWVPISKLHDYDLWHETYRIIMQSTNLPINSD